jgi:hypothetical protein
LALLIALIIVACNTTKGFLRQKVIDEKWNFCVQKTTDENRKSVVSKPNTSIFWAIVCD